VTHPWRPPADIAEWVAWMERRMRAVERSPTVRVGEFVLSDQGGALVATRPGGALQEVGNPLIEPIVADLTRGYVTPDEVEAAVKGTTTAKSAKINAAAAFAGLKWGDLTGTINGIVAGIKGFALPDLLADFAAGDVQVAVGDQSDTISKINNAVLLLQQQSNSGAENGTSVFVDFSTYPDSPSLPTEFTVTNSSPGPGAGSGGWTTDGGKLVWDRGTGNRDATALYNVAESQTDYQMVSAVFASSPGKRTNIAGVTYFTRNVLRARVNASDDTAIEVQFGLEGFLLGYWDAGVWTQWTSKTHNFRTSAIYSLVPGTAGGLRIYQIVCNGEVLLTWPEVGTASQLGAGFRGGGAGVRVNGHDNQTGTDATQLLPGKMVAFAFADNAPAPVPGVAARFYRASASGVAHGTSTKFANNLLDTIDYCSDVFEWIPGTNCRVKVLKRGQFIVNVRVRANSADAGYATLYINGGSNPRNGAHFPSATFGWTFQVWLEEGDYFEPGVQQGSSRSFVGDATGTETYLEIIKVA